MAKKKTKYATDKEAKLQELLRRIEGRTVKPISSSSNPPQLPSTLSWHERESREAEMKQRDAAAAKKR